MQRVNLKTGVPSPWATDWLACWKQGRTVGSKWGQESEVSSLFIAAPHHSHYLLSFTSCQVSDSIRFS